VTPEDDGDPVGGAKPPLPPPSMVRAAARGLSWSLLSAVGQAVLQVVALVVLAHLLPVEEFGIAAAATLVMGLAVMLSQLGIAPALVQARNLDRTDVASAFVLTSALGVVLAAALIAVAPVLGRFLGLPPGSTYLQLLSIVLVLGGLSAVSAGLLQRQMRFRALATVDLLSYGVGYLGTAVTLAYAGAGAAAIIWGQIAQALVDLVGYYALVRHDIRPPGLGVMVSRLRRLVRFGSGYSLSQFGNWLATNGDNLVITSTLGPTSLGIYSRAYQLLVQPANLIGSVSDKVLFPAMSTIQDDHRRLTRAFILVNSMIAILTIPASVLLFVLAPEVVHVLLGPQWSAVVVPLQVFAVVLLPRTAYKISGSLTRATGAVFGGALRQWIYAGEVVLGSVIGSRWGIVGVAVGASIAIVLHTGAMLKFSGRLSDELVRRVLRAYAKALLPAAGAAAVAWPLATRLRGGATPDLVTLVVTGAAGAVSAGLVMLCCFTWFRAEIAILRRAAPGGEDRPRPERDRRSGEAADPAR
jgi:O-antigen/teichoic acid export membrane protein